MLAKIHPISAAGSQFRSLTIETTNRGSLWSRYADTPKSMPIPAVAAIAKAPQKVTRAIALEIGAPPAFAETPPSKAKKNSDNTVTMTEIIFSGEKNAAASGKAAPTAKLAAEASAA